MKFNERLVFLRNKRGLTQADIAQKKLGLKGLDTMLGNKL